MDSLSLKKREPSYGAADNRQPPVLRVRSYDGAVCEVYDQRGANVNETLNKQPSLGTLHLSRRLEDLQSAWSKCRAKSR